MKERIAVVAERVACFVRASAVDADQSFKDALFARNPFNVAFHKRVLLRETRVFVFVGRIVFLNRRPVGYNFVLVLFLSFGIDHTLVFVEVFYEYLFFIDLDLT